MKKIGKVPLYAGLDHITGHGFESLVEVLAELRIRPVQIPDEGLEGVQLPEELLRRGAPVAAKRVQE